MIDIDAIDLVSTKGFTEAFWRLYGQGGRCQEDCFLILDEIYFERFGEHRYVSFDAFRKRRDRQLKKRR